MNSILEIAAVERNQGVRALIARYKVDSLRELIAAYNNREKYIYAGCTVERKGWKISIKTQGESTEVDLGNASIPSEKRDQVLQKAGDDIKRYLQEHWSDIQSGKIKAVDIGGALYAAVTGAILAILVPFANLGPLGKVLTMPIVSAATQQGRYWGAAVDEIFSILKQESSLKLTEIAGVFASVTFIAVYLPGAAPLIQLGGADAWNLTVDIGSKIGRETANAVETVVSVVGNVGNGIGAAVSSAVDEIINLF